MNRRGKSAKKMHINKTNIVEVSCLKMLSSLK